MRRLNKEIWPYQLIIDNCNLAIDKWCDECIGLYFHVWFGYELGNGKKLYAFKSEDDFFIFKLTWEFKCLKN